MYWVGQNFNFFHILDLVALSCLQLHCTVIAVICDSCHISVHLKKTSKLVNFCAMILILKTEENMQYFGILCIITSRKVKTQLKRKEKDLCSVWRRCCD